jgi:small subunit ribosomal protein S19
MSRSLYKGPYSEIFVAENFSTTIWSRRSTVLPIHIEKRFKIYNGKKFIPLKVSPEMIGHKFGEFAITRKKAIHKTNKKKALGKKK